MFGLHKAALRLGERRIQRLDVSQTVAEPLFGEQQGAPGAIGDDRVPGNRQQQGHRPDGVTGLGGQQALGQPQCVVREGWRQSNGFIGVPWVVTDHRDIGMHRGEHEVAHLARHVLAGGHRVHHDVQIGPVIEELRQQVVRHHVVVRTDLPIVCVMCQNRACDVETFLD